VLPALIVLTLLGVLAGGAYIAAQSVFFLGTDARGLVTMYRGLPYKLPGGIDLYSTYYVSGVGASSLSPTRRSALLDHKWRSEKEAGSLVHSIELEELSE
jgi:protein phosphatase